MRMNPAAHALLLLSVATISMANMNGSATTSPSISSRDYNPAVEYQRGMEALKANRYADAKQSFLKIYSSAPRDANMNLVVGIAFMGLEDFKGARKYLEMAVKLDGKLVLAHERLGVTYAKLGERAKAEAEVAALQQILAACGAGCPDSDALSRAISSVTGALGQPQAAIPGPGELMFASTADGDAFYLDAIGLIHERRYIEALDSLSRAKSVFGSHPDILTYIGFANRKLGRFAEAEAYYLQALAAAPQHKGATEYYGELMVERGDLAGANAMLERLDRLCTFGCAEADELRKWIREKHAPAT